MVEGAGHSPVPSAASDVCVGSSACWPQPLHEDQEEDPMQVSFGADGPPEAAGGGEGADREKAVITPGAEGAPREPASAGSVSSPDGRALTGIQAAEATPPMPAGGGRQTDDTAPDEATSMDIAEGPTDACAIGDTSAPRLPPLQEEEVLDGSVEESPQATDFAHVLPRGAARAPSPSRAVALDTGVPSILVATGGRMPEEDHAVPSANDGLQLATSQDTAEVGSIDMSPSGPQAVPQGIDLPTGLGIIVPQQPTPLSPSGVGVVLPRKPTQDMPQTCDTDAGLCATQPHKQTASLASSASAGAAFSPPRPATASDSSFGVPEAMQGLHSTPPQAPDLPVAATLAPTGGSYGRLHACGAVLSGVEERSLPGSQDMSATAHTVNTGDSQTVLAFMESGSAGVAAPARDSARLSPTHGMAPSGTAAFTAASPLLPTSVPPRGQECEELLPPPSPPVFAECSAGAELFLLGALAARRVETSAAASRASLTAGLGQEAASPPSVLCGPTPEAPHPAMQSCSVGTGSLGLHQCVDENDSGTSMEEGGEEADYHAIAATPVCPPPVSPMPRVAGAEMEVATVSTSTLTLLSAHSGSQECSHEPLFSDGVPLGRYSGVREGPRGPAGLLFGAGDAGHQREGLPAAPSSPGFPDRGGRAGLGADHELTTTGFDHSPPPPPGYVAATQAGGSPGHVSPVPLMSETALVTNEAQEVLHSRLLRQDARPTASPAALSQVEVQDVATGTLLPPAITSALEVPDSQFASSPRHPHAVVAPSPVPTSPSTAFRPRAPGRQSLASPLAASRLQPHGHSSGATRSLDDDRSMNSEGDEMDGEALADDEGVDRVIIVNNALFAEPTFAPPTDDSAGRMSRSCASQAGAGIPPPADAATGKGMPAEPAAPFVACLPPVSIAGEPLASPLHRGERSNSASHDGHLLSQAAIASATAAGSVQEVGSQSSTWEATERTGQCVTPASGVQNLPAVKDRALCVPMSSDCEADIATPHVDTASGSVHSTAELADTLESIGAAVNTADTGCSARGQADVAAAPSPGAIAMPVTSGHGVGTGRGVSSEADRADALTAEADWPSPVAERSMNTTGVLDASDDAEEESTFTSTNRTGMGTQAPLGMTTQVEASVGAGPGLLSEKAMPEACPAPVADAGISALRVVDASAGDCTDQGIPTAATPTTVKARAAFVTSARAGPSFSEGSPFASEETESSSASVSAFLPVGKAGTVAAATMADACHGIQGGGDIPTATIPGAPATDSSDAQIDASKVWKPPFPVVAATSPAASPCAEMTSPSSDAGAEVGNRKTPSQTSPPAAGLAGSWPLPAVRVGTESVSVSTGGHWADCAAATSDSSPCVSPRPRTAAAPTPAGLLAAAPDDAALWPWASTTLEENGDSPTVTGAVDLAARSAELRGADGLCLRNTEGMAPKPVNPSSSSGTSMPAMPWRSPHGPGDGDSLTSDLGQDMAEAAVPGGSVDGVEAGHSRLTPRIRSESGGQQSPSTRSLGADDAWGAEIDGLGVTQPSSMEVLTAVVSSGELEAGSVVSTAEGLGDVMAQDIPSPTDNTSAFQSGSDASPTQASAEARSGGATPVRPYSMEDDTEDAVRSSMDGGCPMASGECSLDPATSQTGPAQPTPLQQSDATQNPVSCSVGTSSMSHDALIPSCSAETVDSMETSDHSSGLCASLQDVTANTQRESCGGLSSPCPPPEPSEAASHTQTGDSLTVPSMRTAAQIAFDPVRQERDVSSPRGPAVAPSPAAPTNGSTQCGSPSIDSPGAHGGHGASTRTVTPVVGGSNSVDVSMEEQADLATIGLLHRPEDSPAQSPIQDTVYEPIFVTPAEPGPSCPVEDSGLWEASVDSETCGHPGMSVDSSFDRCGFEGGSLLSPPGTREGVGAPGRATGRVATRGKMETSAPWKGLGAATTATRKDRQYLDGARHGGLEPTEDAAALAPAEGLSLHKALQEHRGLVSDGSEAPASSPHQLQGSPSLPNGNPSSALQLRHRPGDPEAESFVQKPMLAFSPPRAGGGSIGRVTPLPSVSLDHPSQTAPPMMSITDSSPGALAPVIHQPGSSGSPSLDGSPSRAYAGHRPPASPEVERGIRRSIPASNLQQSDEHRASAAVGTQASLDHTAPAMALPPYANRSSAQSPQRPGLQRDQTEVSSALLSWADTSEGQPPTLPRRASNLHHRDDLMDSSGAGGGLGAQYHFTEDGRPTLLPRRDSTIPAEAAVPQAVAVQGLPPLQPNHARLDGSWGRLKAPPVSPHPAEFRDIGTQSTGRDTCLPQLSRDGCAGGGQAGSASPVTSGAGESLVKKSSASVDALPHVQEEYGVALPAPAHMFPDLAAQAGPCMSGQSPAPDLQSAGVEVSGPPIVESDALAYSGIAPGPSEADNLAAQSKAARAAPKPRDCDRAATRDHGVGTGPWAPILPRRGAQSEQDLDHSTAARHDDLGRSLDQSQFDGFDTQLPMLSQLDQELASGTGGDRLSVLPQAAMGTAPQVDYQHAPITDQGSEVLPQCAPVMSRWGAQAGEQWAGHADYVASRTSSEAARLPADFHLLPIHDEEEEEAHSVPILSRWEPSAALPQADHAVGLAGAPWGADVALPLPPPACDSEQDSDSILEPALSRWQSLQLAPVDPTAGQLDTGIPAPAPEPGFPSRESGALAGWSGEPQQPDESHAESSGFLDLLDIASAAAALEPVESMGSGSTSHDQRPDHDSHACPVDGEQWPESFTSAPFHHLQGSTSGWAYPPEFNGDTQPAFDPTGHSRLCADNGEGAPLRPQPSMHPEDAACAPALPPEPTQDHMHMWPASRLGYDIALPQDGWHASSVEDSIPRPSAAAPRLQAEGELLLSAWDGDDDESHPDIGALDRFLTLTGQAAGPQPEPLNGASAAPPCDPAPCSDGAVFDGGGSAVTDSYEAEAAYCGLFPPEDGYPSGPGHSALLSPEQPQHSQHDGYAALRPASPTVPQFHPSFDSSDGGSMLHLARELAGGAGPVPPGGVALLGQQDDDSGFEARHELTVPHAQVTGAAAEQDQEGERHLASLQGYSRLGADQLAQGTGEQLELSGVRCWQLVPPLHPLPPPRPSHRLLPTH